MSAGFREYIGDSYTDIQRCLSCPYPKCFNCLDKKTDLGSMVKKTPRVETTHFRKRKLSKSEQAVLKYYVGAKNDEEIGLKVGKHKTAIRQARVALGLPAPKKTPTFIRKELLEKVLQEVREKYGFQT